MATLEKDRILQFRGRELCDRDGDKIGSIEEIYLDADSGECFGFNSPAAAVWRHLKEPISFDQLRAALVAEYDVRDEQCTAELSDLLQDMQAKGLVDTD